MTVIVVDGAGGSDATGLTINVSDTNEAPSTPARPTVRATEKSSTSLDVSWTAPANMGPAITSYDVQYRKGTGSFSTDGVDVTGTTATISGTDADSDDAPWLDDDTTYEVVIRANNEEGRSLWSSPGTGRTNRANHDPIFDDRPHTDDPPGTPDESMRNTAFTVSRRVDENARAGQVVGRVFADDEDNDKLTYKLGGTDASKFNIDASTGQIRTKAGVVYDYEAITAVDTCAPLPTTTPNDIAKIGSDKCYTVTVEVRDGLNVDRVAVEEATADDMITVKIGVRNRDEPPAVPTVTVTSPADTTTLGVFWDAKNTGPDITSYSLRYRKGGDPFSDDNCGAEAPDNCRTLTGVTTTILDLEADTSYSVQVRATNPEGTSAWSRVETVKTNKSTNTAPPVFTETAATVELSVPEKTPAGRSVGDAVGATDSSTRLTYELRGSDAALFSIVRTTGQIRTRAALNHEDPACYDPDPDGAPDTDDSTCTYKVRVKVEDGEGGSASKDVTISGDGRGRVSVSAGRAQGDCDGRYGPEPRRELERAAGNGWATHHRLRHRVP